MAVPSFLPSRFRVGRTKLDVVGWMNSPAAGQSKTVHLLLAGAHMEMVIQFSEREEAKALPILLRDSPGCVLPNRVYVLSQHAVQALQNAGVVFRELSRTGVAPAVEGVASGERV